MGLVAGIGVGVLGGLARASGYRSATPVGITLTTLGVLVAANGPMTVLGVTDPRTWSATDWISDLVPHLAYGVVVDRKSTRLNSSHANISYAVFCLKKKKLYTIS